MTFYSRVPSESSLPAFTLPGQPRQGENLVLDFAGNVRRHGQIDLVRPKRPGGPAAPKDLLPVRDSRGHHGARMPNCGHEFPGREMKLESTASTLEVLSTGKPQSVRPRGGGDILLTLVEREGDRGSGGHALPGAAVRAKTTASANGPNPSTEKSSRASLLGCLLVV